MHGQLLEQVRITNSIESLAYIQIAIWYPADDAVNALDRNVNNCCVVDRYIASYLTHYIAI